MDVSAFRQACLENNYPAKDIARFLQTIEFITPLLKHKQRLAGDSYFDHNLRVGIILAENKSEPDFVIAGLLHGILDHTQRQYLENKFGKEIVAVVEEVGQLRELKIQNTQLGGEAINKLIIATLRDVRTIFIKLANKLDNLGTIQVFPPEEQKRLAEETLSVYAPLAYRLGIEKIRVELEDAAFSILNPQKYREISHALEETRVQREKKVEAAITTIRDLIKNKILLENIMGRPKHIYSIYKKMMQKKKSLQEIYDLIGIRIIVKDVKECYSLLALLHTMFEPVEGRLKDYITNPKPNFYRSLHTSLVLPTGKIAEVQIRTPEMDDFAEEGLAAHWRYKGIGGDQLFERKVAWLRGVLDLQKNSENREFLESMKLDLFGDKIYCYTPKGDVKELPEKATVLDFAYLIHEEIGNTCIGARVNGKFVPIKQMLSSGDVVEILTGKLQRPRRGWLKIVTSAKARQKIRKSLKEHETLPAFHFRLFKPLTTGDQAILVECEALPKAICVLAKCCLAIPGDDIIGAPTKRRVISVHWKECRQALKEEKRWIPVQWKKTFSQRIKFHVEADDRSGLLAELLHSIAHGGFDVKEAKAKLIGRGYAQCSFLVIPRELEELKMMIVRLRKVRGVKKIFFE